jgi:hypothetical protein
MKLFKLSSLLGLAAMLVMGLTGSAFAFHDGGVAKCDGCHTMHNSKNGAVMTTDGVARGTALVGNAYLLQGSDASSTCLGCHGKGTTLSGYHVDTDAAGYTGTTVPAQRTPGGDFAWLKATLNAATNTIVAAASEATNRHGHHIVASDYGFAAATMNGGIAPGGTYVAANLGCNSCHNPHNNLRGDGSSLPISESGSYGGTPEAGTANGVYRFLGGVGYKIPADAVVFGAAPPVAVAPNTYNAADNSVASQVRVAYGTGMSEWCANCHGGIINPDSTAGTTHRHVAGASALLTVAAPLGEIPADIYNGYVNSGATTGGSQTSSYLALVPYELGTSDTATLLTYASDGSAQIGAKSAEGPSLGTENVMCLSCHRAHATGFDSMTRFDNGVTFITTALGVYSGGTDASYEPAPDTTGYVQAAYNGLPASTFGPSQRLLCNKCHARD